MEILWHSLKYHLNAMIYEYDTNLESVYMKDASNCTEIIIKSHWYLCKSTTNISSEI